ncbi:type III secretion system export apparatus subunit SctT [uncultured Tateyamaria sp.]|uniref:type III secretion system export apparatus subunit SctT n=1 Tax=uncultured Tateyamaria sp. TaxID=455651 RepID=UPI002620AA9C|nr:type III secretion system export apparatus subunit SctT [uncultured Tateyamaria sp.]
MDFDALTPQDLPAVLIGLALSSARIAGIVYASPFLSRKSSTGIVRSAFVVALAITVTPSATPDIASMEGQHDLVFLLLKEIIIGLLLGFAIWLPVRSIEIAGVLLDTQRGSTMAQDFNVVSGSSQATPTAILLEQIFSGWFFTMGGLLVFIDFVFTSYQIWPILEKAPYFDQTFAPVFLDLTGSLLLTSIIFIMPISGFLLIIDIAVAYLAKVAPTINALTFGMPAKSLVVVISLMVYIAILMPIAFDGFGDGLHNLPRILRQ